MNGPYRLDQFERLLHVDVHHRTAAPLLNDHSVAGRLGALFAHGTRFSRGALEGCGQLKSPSRNVFGYVPEPLWHLGLGVFAFIEGDGDQAAHEWSSDDDRYDERQTQDRLDRIRLTTSGVTTCARFHQENPETCEACPHWQTIKSPISLASRSGTKHERPRADKPRLLIEDCNPDRTVTALRDILASVGALYDRGVPVRLAFDRIQGGTIAQVMTPDALVLLGHMLCRPYVLKTKNDSSVYEADGRLPYSFAKMYLEWRGEWRLPPLNGIATAPLLHEDGTIKSAEGYDPNSGMWCERVPDLTGLVPEQPNKDQAQAALRVTRETFKTFCFADAVTVDVSTGVPVVDTSLSPGRDESAFLVALLTAVCRPSLYLAPGVLLRAAPMSGAGAGKGLLALSITHNSGCV
jgi:hypothetical protein